MDIGKSIKKALYDARMSQRELARRLKADPAYVNRIANGKANLQITMLGEIASILGIRASQLIALGETGPAWNEGPEDAEFARHWMGEWHWFKRHPELKNMWQKFSDGKWWLTSMDNCTFISLIPRPEQEFAQ